MHSTQVIALLAPELVKPVDAGFFPCRGDGEFIPVSQFNSLRAVSRLEDCGASQDFDGNRGVLPDDEELLPVDWVAVCQPDSTLEGATGDAFEVARGTVWRGDDKRVGNDPGKRGAAVDACLEADCPKGVQPALQDDVVEGGQFTAVDRCAELHILREGDASLEERIKALSFAVALAPWVVALVAQGELGDSGEVPFGAEQGAVTPV